LILLTRCRRGATCYRLGCPSSLERLGPAKIGNGISPENLPEKERYIKRSRLQLQRAVLFLRKTQSAPAQVHEYALPSGRLTVSLASKNRLDQANIIRNGRVDDNVGLGDEVDDATHVVYIPDIDCEP
jgi:hypothetical protein